MSRFCLYSSIRWKTRTNPYVVEHYFLCGTLEDCGIGLVGYIGFEICTYLGICDNIRTRHFSPSISLTSESNSGHRDFCSQTTYRKAKF